jgi:hypothetical protein
MAACVAGQEINLSPTEFAADNKIGWWTERGIELLFAHFLQAFHLIETASPDHTYGRNVSIHSGGD